MVFVAYMGYQNGNILRLYYGNDYLGNPCSINSTSQPVDLDESLLGNSSWAERSTIWYPITTDIFHGQSKSLEQQVRDVMKIGVCVSQCPQPGASMFDQTVDTYSSPVIRYPVTYASTAVLHRCIPDLASNLTLDAVKTLLESFDGINSWSSFFASVSQSFMSGLPAMGLAMGATCAACLFLIFIFRWTVGPIVYMLLLTTDLLILAGGAFLIYYGGTLAGTEQQSYTGFVYVCSGLCFFVALVYTLVLMFMFKRIQIAVAVLEMSSRVIISAPSIVLVPICSIALVFAALAWGVVVEGFLYTAGTFEIQDLNVSNPMANISTLSTPLGSVANLTDQLFNNSDINGYMTDATITIPISVLNQDWTGLAFRIYNLVGTLWTMAFLNGAAFMTIAFVTESYYFSHPEDKSVPCCGVLRGAWKTLRYHLGTVAFGSLILAVVQFIQLLAAWFQSKAEASQNDAMKWLGRCIQCALQCLNRLVNYLNRNAYIMCVIESQGFCAACCSAVDLLLECLTEVATANFLAEWVFIFSKLSITGGAVAFTYWLLGSTHFGEGVDHVLVYTIIIGILSYLLASVFFHVYDCVQDTILLCYCYDKQHNNGTPDKPYYFSKELGDILNKYNMAKAHGKVAPVDGDVDAAEKPPAEAVLKSAPAPAAPPRILAVPVPPSEPVVGDVQPPIALVKRGPGGSPPKVAAEQVAGAYRAWPGGPLAWRHPLIGDEEAPSVDMGRPSERQLWTDMFKFENLPKAVNPNAYRQS